VRRPLSPSLSQARSRALPRLYAITDVERLGADRVVGALAAAVDGGLAMVVVREPAAPIETVDELIARIVAACGQELAVLVACRGGASGSARLELASRRSLAGVHVGGGDPSFVRVARNALAPATLVGYSAHSVDDARRAFDAGATHVSLSPVFSPLSKRSDLAPLGVDGLRDACRRLDGPVFALGGIASGNVASVRDAGAHGVATIAALLESDDPCAVARALLVPWT